MSDEASAVAESTPAVEAPVMQVDRGPLVNLTSDQRAEFRKTGELPKPITEVAATSSEAKPQGEAKQGESETPHKPQDRSEPKPKQTAAERVAELKATIAKIEKGAGLDRTEAESSPAKPEPKPQPVQPATRPKPTAEDKKEDGTPKFDTYEDFVEDLSDWKSEQREAKGKREQREQAQAEKTQAKVAEAKSRYDNFAEVVEPAVDAIVGDASISPVVKEMLNDSDIFADLMYTIASDKEQLESFIKMAKESPGKAIRYIALTESLINEELAGKEAKPSEENPAKPKTQVPRPPSEAGGRAATPPDALISAAKTNDYRSFRDEHLRRDLAKLKS
jgi:hypothetical protein